MLHTVCVVVVNDNVTCVVVVSDNVTCVVVVSDNVCIYLSSRCLSDLLVTVDPAYMCVPSVQLMTQTNFLVHIVDEISPTV